MPGVGPVGLPPPQHQHPKPPPASKSSYLSYLSPNLARASFTATPYSDDMMLMMLHR